MRRPNSLSGAAGARETAAATTHTDSKVDTEVADGCVAMAHQRPTHEDLASVAVDALHARFGKPPLAQGALATNRTATPGCPLQVGRTGY